MLFILRNLVAGKFGFGQINRRSGGLVSELEERGAFVTDEIDLR
jgi:hypothetical protein